MAYGFVPASRARDICLSGGLFGPGRRFFSEAQFREQLFAGTVENLPGILRREW